MKAKVKDVFLNCSWRGADSPRSQPQTQTEEKVVCAGLSSNPAPLSAAAEAFWAPLVAGRGQPQGGQVRRLGNDVEQGLGVSFGKNKHTKRKRLVPTPEGTAVWKHLLPESSVENGI